MAMTGGNAVLVKSEKGNYGQSSNSINLYVYWKEISQNEKNNETLLSLGMYVSVPTSYNIGPWGDYTGSYIGTETSGDNCHSFNGSVPNFSGTRWLVENKEITVKHEDDGTKTVPLYWKWGINSPWGGYEKPSGSLKIELTPIPRVSAVSAVGGDIGSQLNIKIARENEAFTHSLEYSFGTASGVIGENFTGTSVIWTPPMELCREIPNAETGVCTIICKTYSDGELIGTSNCEIVLHVPDNVVLSTKLGWINMEPYNVGTAASGMDEFIQGVSKAEITFEKSLLNTENSYGATPASYKISFKGTQTTIEAVDGAVYRTPTLTGAGQFTVECQVIDTRGRSFSIFLFRNVQAYSPPTLSDVEAFRCDARGNPSDTGTYIYVKATPIYSSINGLNTVSFKARYKVRGGSYSEDIPLTSGVASIIGGGLISPSMTYITEISVIDALGKPAIYTGYIPMDDNFFCGRKGGKGAGFGGYAKRDNLLYVGWDAHIKGDLYIGEDEVKVDVPVEVGSVVSISVIWTYRRWNSGIVECWARNNNAPANGKIRGQIPFEFAAQPIIFVGNAHDGTKPIYVTREPLYESGVYGYNLYLTDGDGSPVSVNPGVDIYVQGRWK